MSEPDDLLATYPLSAPTSDQARLDWLRLARSRRVGPATFRRLIHDQGTAAAALALLPKIAAASGAQDYYACTREQAMREFEAGQRAGAQMLCLGDPHYPALLADIDDPPPVLWALGDTGLSLRPCVALVGARNASSLGLRMAQKLAEELSQLGMVVVSGLARGIDAAAHRAALAGGTIAVQAGGIDVIYPQENADLSHDIGAQGLRLSEMPPGLTPQARHFPRRNRIISGLSRAVVVVEGAARSGSLITARNALDQGRDVMAVPGHPFDARASGCNILIRDGATLVRSGVDVAEALSVPMEADVSPLRSAREKPPARRVPAATIAVSSSDPLTDTILNVLGPAPLAEDLLIRQTGLPVQQVMEALMTLDLDGRISRHPGGLVSRMVA